MSNPTAVREHGSRAKYVVERCRCDLCRESTRVYERERSKRVAPAYVGADRARQHIRWLSEQGVGLKQIAKVSPVSQGALWKLLYGKRRPDGTRVLSRRIRPETEAAILAVLPDQGADGSRVPAGPVWEIVERLLARGWTKAAIARRVHGEDARALQLGGELVTRRNARAVQALLDEPVPPRRSRFGEHPVEPDDDAADEAPPEPAYELPDLRLPAGTDLSWQDAGTCRRPDYPTWLFFPGRGDTETTRRAKDACARCPVIDACLDFALTTGQKHGIWGGTAERERRGLRRERAEVAA